VRQPKQNPPRKSNPANTDPQQKQKTLAPASPFCMILNTGIEIQVFTMQEKPSVRAPTNTQQHALNLITAAFPPEAGLYKKSVILTDRSIVLHFRFPAIAERKYEDVIEQLQTQTPWHIKLNPDPHQQEMINMVHRYVPESWRILKRPSLHLDVSKVVVQVGALGSPEEVAVVRTKFQEETGFVLRFEEIKGAMPEAPIEPYKATKEEPEHKEPNAAFQRIRQAFEATPHPVLRVGMKIESEAFIEVCFISPQVGQRYKEQLQQLSKEVGWEIRLRSTADQQKIKELAKQTAEKFSPKKEPSFRPEAMLVEMKVGRIPERTVADQLSHQFEDQTGFRLLFV
jgi:hypothetical protein